MFLRYSTNVIGAITVQYHFTVNLYLTFCTCLSIRAFSRLGSCCLQFVLHYNAAILACTVSDFSPPCFLPSFPGIVLYKLISSCVNISRDSALYYLKTPFRTYNSPVLRKLFSFKFSGSSIATSSSDCSQLSRRAAVRHRCSRQRTALIVNRNRRMSPTSALL